MKRKFQLFILTMLCSTSFIQAQTTDVWDFGAVALTGDYNNLLNVATINGWYGATAAGTAGINFPGNFTVGDLSWVGPAGKDRLRTSNTALTRYDAGLGTVGTTGYTGRLYVNGAPVTDRMIVLNLKEDDVVTVVATSESSAGTLNFQDFTNKTQLDYFGIAITATAAEYKFVAKKAGVYHIYDSTGKASYYRVYRKAANYKTITGTVNESQAAGISGYSVVFTNAAGKTWTVPVTSGTYSVSLPSGNTYTTSLANANGYIIKPNNALVVSDSTLNFDFTVTSISLSNVSGTITGLDLGDVSKLVSLTYTPDPSANTIYVPKPVISGSNYSVDLEPGVAYTISGQGVNDYSVSSTNPITISGAQTGTPIVFVKKAVYPVTITTVGLTTAQQAKLTLTFTNLNESGYVYPFAYGSAISLRDGTYAVTYGGVTAAADAVELKLISNLVVKGAAASKTLTFRAVADTSPIAYTSPITVGTDKTYQTINAALAAVARMTTRSATDRVVIMVDPGNYEEMIVISSPNITLRNAASTPSIALTNAGVGIDPNAVRITSYYGVGYNYFSQGTDNKWSADALAVNKANGYTNYNSVSGSTNGSYWNATAVINANGFEADNIIFENSYNQYISNKESQDVVVMVAGNKGLRPTTAGSTAVQAKSFVERAAAIGVPNNIDKVVLNNCRVVGRQDSFFGGTGARVVVYKGVMMGATDYIFGGMDAVFYQTALAMNTSEDSNDVSYITAPQQSAGRGYLMYQCTITSAIPGTETASAYRSKPGYFGRPWALNTSEVVYYNTTIETSNNPSFAGQSLIVPLGWNNSLSGNSVNMYEYGTIENSGVNNSASRATWATTLTTPTLLDNTTAITTLNFTKGTDGWDPISKLNNSQDPLGVKNYQPQSAVVVYGYKNTIAVSGVKSKTTVLVYGLNGALVNSFETATDTTFDVKAGVWIVVVKAADGQKTVKLMTY